MTGPSETYIRGERDATIVAVCGIVVFFIIFGAAMWAVSHYGPTGNAVGTGPGAVEVRP